MQKTVLFVVAAGHVSSASRVTPVQKVVTMMENMLAKAKKDKQAEEVQFAAYKQFCDDTSAEKTRVIKKAGETIESLNAAIEKNNNDVEQLVLQVGGHNADIAVWEGDKKAATNVRKIEKKDYDTTHADYTESIYALQRAIAVLKKQNYDRKQASSLAQVSALRNLDLIPASAKRTLDVFLSEPSEAMAVEAVAVEAPEANGYEFQSSSVIEMLEKLLSKFLEERTTLQKTEANNKHSYQLLVQDLSAQIEQAQADVVRKTTTKTKKGETVAGSKEDLADTTSTMNDDKKYLADLTATCELKKTNFASRQKLRGEEMQAIEKAIEIISSSAVGGNAKKHLPALTQRVALAKLRARGYEQTRVAKYLQERAGELDSRVLALVAQHAVDDPFVKVKKMIKDLIVRLMEESNDEAEHKGWCDTELKTNEQTRKEKTSKVETLRAEADGLTASIAKLTEELGALSKAVSDLAAAMAKATKLRQTEKEKNAATTKDAQEAQTAIAQASTILREFYAKAGEAVVLAQKQQPAAPEIFDEPYKGLQGESGGIVGILEVIQSDFARLESDTAAAESTAQREYDVFMTDSKVDKKGKETDIEHKTAKKEDEGRKLLTTKNDLEGTQKELDTALVYFDKLKPSCINTGGSYEDRVARRKEEIASLKEALQILNGEELA